MKKKLYLSTGIKRVIRYVIKNDLVRNVTGIDKEYLVQMSVLLMFTFSCQKFNTCLILQNTKHENLWIIS